MHSHHTEIEGASAASAGASDPLAEARELLEADRRQRMEACSVELQEVLARHGMRLEVTPAQIVLVPAE